MLRVSSVCFVWVQSERLRGAWSCGLLLGVTACATAPRAPAPPVVEVPIAVASVEATTAARPAPTAVRTVGGVFEGRLWTSGDMVQAETVLQLTEPVGSGSYWMMIDEQRVPGLLTDCVAVGELRFTCQWHDRYGNGTLDFIFDPDLQRFEGMWWPEEAPEDKHPWLGTRLLAAASGASTPTAAP